MFDRAQWRRIRRRTIKPGFSKTEPFKSLEDIREYLSGERVLCLECGRYLRTLGSHLRSCHNMTPDDYREKFAIPWTYGLACEENREKHAAAVVLAGLSAGNPDMASVSKLPRRPLAGTVVRQRVDRIKQVNEPPLEAAECSACDAEITKRRSQRDRVQYCDCCRQKHSEFTPKERDRLKKWESENPSRSREYYLAKNWWGWHGNPLPLLHYAERWGAKLRIMPKLLEAVEVFNKSKGENE